MIAVKIAAAVGSGIMAGFYLVFSGMIMPALGRMAAGPGATAMQRINEDAPKVWVPVALTTAVLSVVLAVSGVRRLPGPEGALLLAGAGTYLTSVVLTIGYHIPRNDRLAAIDPDSDRGAAYWTTYLTEWTTMNHARVIVCAVAAVCFTAAAIRWASGGQ